MESASPSALAKAKRREKRRRDEEMAAVPDSVHRHKKSKTQLGSSLCAESTIESSPKKEKSSKKSSKKKSKPEADSIEDVQIKDEDIKDEDNTHDPISGMATAEDDVQMVAAEKEKMSKKKEKKSKIKKAESDSESKVKLKDIPDINDVSATKIEDGVDVVENDIKPALSSSLLGAQQPSDAPSEPDFPFFTQTVSFYIPLYPIGWSEPVSAAKAQHLEPLLNRYVPSIHGVLLSYSNVSVNSAPTRRDAATLDSDPVALSSFNEYAPGFSWVTADVDFFAPSRGAWMDGSVNLQTESHIGVVCFGRFNASIEARRLPKSWSWVPQEEDLVREMDDKSSIVQPADEHGVSRQLASTGYWADASGKRVTGRLRFRIRNFDVGLAGEVSYLSLEGSMLSLEAERELASAEAEREKLRGQMTSKRQTIRPRAPEFALTRFEVGTEPQEGVEAPEPEFVQSSRPENEI